MSVDILKYYCLLIVFRLCQSHFAILTSVKMKHMISIRLKLVASWTRFVQFEKKTGNIILLFVFRSSKLLLIPLFLFLLIKF